MHFCILLCLLVGSANAAIVKNLEFDSAGVLPSNEPDIEFFNNTTSTEVSLYSVNGGILQQQTFSVNGNASYHFPDTIKLDGEIDAALTTIIEARLKIVNIVGLAGTYFQTFDGGNRYSAFFEPSGLALFTSTGNQSFSMDVFDFHTYRLVSLANSDVLNLLVDGTLVASVTAAANSLNGFGFGDGNSASGNGANLEWVLRRIHRRST